MTMVQAVIKSDRAWVISDSICQVRGAGILRNPDATPHQDDKLKGLPRCLITGLGSLALRRHMERHARIFRVSVDEAIDQFPAILRAGYESLGLRVENGNHTALCVGWSDSRGAMVLAEFTARNDFAAVVCAPSQGGMTFWRSPDIERAPFADLPDSLESLIANAHATISEWRGKDPQVAMGGALRLADIARDEITLSIVGDLGSPEPTQEDDNMKAICALALCGALAACGGSDEALAELDGQQLADNAATTPLSYFAASTSLSASGAVSASSNVVTPVSGSYTNPFPYTVYLEMFAACEAVVTTPGAGGNWLMQGSYTIQAVGGATLDARTVGFQTDLSPNPGAISSISYLVALDPGQTFGFSVKGGVGSTSAAVTVAFVNATIRVNVIKK